MGDDNRHYEDEESIVWEELPTTWKVDTTNKYTTWYVVKKGRVPGIYTNWKDCKRQVNRFKGNVYRAFYSQKGETLQDAEEWFNSKILFSLSEEESVKERLDAAMKRKLEKPIGKDIWRKHKGEK